LQIHCKFIANSLQIHCKSILIAFLFNLFSFISFSQDQECGTEDPTEEEMQALPYYGNNAWLDQYADSLAQTFNTCTNCRVEGGNEVWYRVPIKFYVWQWQGLNVFERENMNTDKALKAMMFRLNDAMRRSNVPIRFYMLCPAFPENEQAATGIMNSTDACNLRQNNYTSGVLNCHIVNAMSDLGGIWCGRIDDNIVVSVRNTTSLIEEWGEGNSGINNSLFVHEVGHWLGLQHTHLFHGIPCLKEPVSRGVFWSACPPFYSRHCEIRGDALCDTPADPNLSQHSDDIRPDCSWFINIRDDRGDFYEPDTRNYMSYSKNTCRNNFTWQQRAVMLRGIMLRGINNQTGFFHVGTPNDFDIYEPDNVASAASQIRLNETQEHSFSQVGSCGDDSDWLKFNYPDNGTVSVSGNLQLEVEAIEGFNFPVSEVEFWDGGTSSDYFAPNAVTRLNYLSSNTAPNKITYSIDCNLPIGKTYLFRVVRNRNQTGRYKVTLRNTPNSGAYISGNSSICTSGTYALIGGVGGVVWSSSSNLRITAGDNPNQVIVTANEAAPSSGWIEATTISVCNNRFVTIRKEINITPVAVFQMQIQGPTQVWRGQFATYSINPVAGATGYRWWVVPVNGATSEPIIPYNCSGYFCWGFATGNNGTGTSCTFKVGETDGQIYVEALGTNACNGGTATLRAVYQATGAGGTGGGCPPNGQKCFDVRIANPYPNPTRDNLQIKIEHPENDPEVLAIFASSSYNVFLYNAQGELKAQILGVQGLERSVPIAHLPRGMYYLHVQHPEFGLLQKTIVRE
jgi:hypothetical protein